jgi:membrane associated rhomboid family serine protease
MIGIPSTLQFFFPILLSMLQRDPARFSHGEWWRLVTPLFVQDGGISGTIFNLIALAFVGTIAEQFWNSRSIYLVFFLGGMVGEIVAFAWQPIGAGNSLGNFSLAASIAVICILRRSQKPVNIAAFAAIVAYIVLIGLKDIHGAAAFAGAVLAILLQRSYIQNKQLE